METAKRGISIPRAKMRPIPADFADVAPLHGLNELRKIYSCGVAAVKRWCLESGVEYRRTPTKSGAEKERKKKRLEAQERMNRAECDACLNCQFNRCKTRLNAIFPWKRGKWRRKSRRDEGGNAMKIIEQFARMEPDMTGRAAIKKIARAARVSHKSAGRGFESDCELVRKLIGWGHESVLEHVSMSAYIVTDRAIANELTRHRIGVAFTQESTRYVDFSGGIQVIKPSGISDESKWREVCEEAERAYIRMREIGVTPEMARSALPLCTATTLYVTANLREWRHIFRLRCGKAAHPDIRRLCADLLRQAKEIVPVVFDDLEVDV